MNERIYKAFISIQQSKIILMDTSQSFTTVFIKLKKNTDTVILIDF